MEMFQMIATVAVVTFVCMATWFGGKELLTRWFNNDWCRHDWDMWSAVPKDHGCQYRFCRKCNKAEKRTP